MSDELRDMEARVPPGAPPASDPSPSTPASNTQPQVNKAAPPPLSNPANCDEENEEPNLPGSEDLRSFGAAELQSFQERFRAMESKMGLVDTMYNLHESTVEAVEYGQNDPSGASYFVNEGARHRDNLNFYRDAMFFMRRVRDSHQRLVRFDQARRKQADEAQKLKAARASETEITREISTKAFLSGERLKVMQMDWDSFIIPKTDIEQTILTPIDVVSGEPEPRIILQLSSGKEKFKKGKQPMFRRIERVLPTGVDGVQHPLPERIKILSVQLLAIFSKIKKVPQLNVSEDGSMVFQRPYQFLTYYEGELRERLAVLEKRFENYDGTESSSVPPETADASDKNGSGIPDTSEESLPTLTSNPPSGGENKPKKSGDLGNGLKSEHGDPQDGRDNDDNASKKDHGDDEADENDSSNSITALLHLRCLMDFVDTEIKPKQEYVRGPKCTRIHFHDLWHLFKPGDEVIEQSEKQVYVVLRVQVPNHKVEEPWERWNRQADSDSDSDSSSDEEDPEESESPFTIHCAHIDFDGKSFGPISKRFKIFPFGELKSIRSLPIYPFRFAKESNTRQSFIERGQMLLSVAKFKPMYYMGVTLDKRDEIDSQVVIDFNEALADEERRKAWEPTIRPVSTGRPTQGKICMAFCCIGEAIYDGLEEDSKMTEDYIKSMIPDTSLRAPSLVLSPRSLEDTLSSTAELTDTELLIMTNRVFGFVLRSRKWAQLDLTLLRYENENARNMTVNAFERLELPEGHREMVKSLVIQHFRARQSAFARDEQTDLIQGKGKGLILLLHGAPGVGKTTTAEGIAELFRKPLFQITCGDLGTTAKEVETELEKNFALASRWGCVLLLDEADVFLSARERMDFKRNGLVAVFLRVLEYYTGILFLTTNRIGDFDEAFASRIHMSLYYPELDEEKTLKVFKLNLDLIQQRFDKQGRSIIFDVSSIEDFAQQHFQQQKYNRWNGRQIRNACQTALALAEFDAQGGTLEIDGGIDRSAVVRLELKYFKTVQRAYLDFDKYLGDIQGTQGDRRAIDFKLRARTDTPYQSTRRNLFSQREDSRSATGQNLRPEYLHTHRTSSDMSQASYGPQADLFNQGYAPATPSAGIAQHQGYGQYHHPQPSPLQSFQGQLRPGPVVNPAAYESSSSFGQAGSSQQGGQPDARFSQRGQPGQQSFESPQQAGASQSAAHGAETPQQQQQQRGGMSYDGSPLPSRAVPHQHAQYGYGNISQGGGLPNPNPTGSVHDAPGYAPHSIFRGGQGGLASPGNHSQM